ncbi:MAG: energy transducer TonB [Bacteroidales bacterium]|nr:energy transducer TonB [Bacteroidales bacterium]
MTSDEIDRIITMPDIDMEWKAFRDSVIQRSQTKRRIYRSVRDFAFVLGIVVMVSAVGYASAKASGKVESISEFLKVPHMQEERIVQFPEEYPRFPEGNEKILSFVAENLHYPPEALERGLQGRCVISFIIETDGSISGAKVIKSLGSSLDSEAMRIVNLMPKWIPAKDKGKAVRSECTIPIVFRIN